MSWMVASPMGLAGALSLADRFVASFTVLMQENIGDIMDLEHLVVDKMVKVSLPRPHFLFSLPSPLALPSSTLPAPVCARMCARICMWCWCNAGACWWL